MSERAVVLLFEDEYFSEFHNLVKRLRRLEGGSGILEGRTARGTGGFSRELRSVLRVPLKQTRHPPDLVVCVGDADRPTNLVGRRAEAPGGSTDEWVEDLEARWKAKLVSDERLTVDETARVRVVIVRWSKESLLVASPAALLSYGRRLGGEAGVERVLNECTPRPNDVDSSVFADTFRRPDECMEKVLRAIDPHRGYKKGRDDDDILRNHILRHDDRVAEVRARCPDLMRLVAVIGGGSPAS